MRNPHIFPRGPEEPERPPPPRIFCFFAILARSPPIRPPATIYTPAHTFGVYYIYILNRPSCWRSPQERPDTAKRPPIQTAAPPVFHTQISKREFMPNMTHILYNKTAGKARHEKKVKKNLQKRLTSKENYAKMAL